MKALLVIGMQVDLLPGGPAEVPESQGLVPILNQLLPNYDLVVAANFSLPADHVIFAANHPWRKPGQTIPIEGQPTLLHHIFCVSGSFGSELIPGLKADGIAFTVLMGTNRAIEPHSAFFDSGKKRDTGLAGFLISQNVSELHVAGMPLESAVFNSAIDGSLQGFKVSLLKNACRGRSDAAISDSLHQLEQAGISLLTV